jgi:hypothetical protein
LPRGTKLRISDVKELFLQMRDHGWLRYRPQAVLRLVELVLKAKPKG